MKNTRRIYISIGVVLSLMALTAIFAFRQEAQTNNPNQPNQQDQDDQPTIVKRGQVTDKEKEYSKEYQKLYRYRKSRKLGEISNLGKAKGNKGEIGVMIGPIDTVSIDEKPISTSEFIKNLSCKADAIVFGSIKSKTAHMTEDETFVYTEYEFSVKAVEKSNPSFPILANNSIQITRPGGLIKLEDQQIRAEDVSYEMLQRNKEYLLFLRFMPAANGYVVSSPEGDFELDNGHFRSLSKVGIPEELANLDLQLLLNGIRNSLASGCK